jgi:uncharacterized membrane protein
MGGFLGIESLSFSPLGGHPAWGALLLAVAVLFSYWAYRTTLPAVTPRTRFLLLALRCLSFAVLALILFQPVASVIAPHSARPALPVLVDVSTSMETPLGSAEDDTLKARLDAAERVAAFVGESLGDRYRVPVYQFGLEAVGPARGIDLVLPDTSGVKYATAIGEALEEIALRREAESVVGIVLVSDGTVNRGEDPLRSLRSIAVPVYTVVLGDTHGVPDTQVFEVRANPTAYVGSEVPVRIIVKSQGYEGAAVTLQLREGAGDEIVAAKEIVLAGVGFEQEVDMTFVPRAAGERFFTVSLEAMEGEQTLENNQRSLAIDVRQEKLEVLFVEGRPSWEFTFLKRALDGAGNLSTSYLVAFDGQTLRPLGRRAGNFPSDTDGLEGYSLVIIGDCDPSLLSVAQWSALVEYVRGGGGVILLSGRSASGLNRFSTTPVAELVPLDLQPGIASRVPGTFAVSLTTAGREHPITKVDVDIAVCDSLWANLPPLLEAYLVGHPRSRSQVLASVRSEGTAVPVLAVRNFGQGKVLAVNSSSLWRWGFLSEGLLGSRTLYDRLWGNAVRWLTAGKDEGVSVFAERRVYQSGETVRLGATVTGEGYRPITGASVSVSLKDAGGRRIARRLSLVDSDVPGHYEGSLESLPPGEYELTGEAKHSSGVLGRASSTFRVDRAGLEYIDLNARADIMRALAAESGGRSYTIDDFERIGEDIGRARLEFKRTVEVDLWNHPGVFILLLALLGLEWTLRRRLGMA